MSVYTRLMTAGRLRALEGARKTREGARKILAGPWYVLSGLLVMVLAWTARAAQATIVVIRCALKGIAQHLAPHWSRWAAACLSLVGLTVVLWTQTSMSLATSFYLCGPGAISCAWMLSARLRDYPKALRYLEDNIGFPWLVFLVLALGTANERINQLVTGSFLTPTLADLMTFDQWRGLGLAVWSLVIDCWRRRRQDQVTGTAEDPDSPAE